MREYIRKILLVIFAGMFIYAAYNLATIGYNYYKIDKDTNEVKEEYVKETNDNDPLKRKIDFTALQKKNKDVIGWLYIPDTKVDGVIMKGKNNDSYLRRNINKQYSTAGEFFIDEVNNKEFTDVNTVIYGHNMKNGSRFHDVRNFVKKDYFNKHRTIYIYLPNGSVNVYKTYASRILDAHSNLYKNGADYGTVVKSIQKNASQIDKASNEEAPLIMLSTCVVHNDPRRYVVGARLEKNVVIES